MCVQSRSVFFEIRPPDLKLKDKTSNPDRCFDGIAKGRNPGRFFRHSVPPILAHFVYSHPENTLQILIVKKIFLNRKTGGAIMDKLKIKGAIVTKYGSQSLAARELGMTERRLSRLLNGHEMAKPKEAKIFARKLGIALVEEIHR